MGRGEGVGRGKVLLFGTDAWGDGNVTNGAKLSSDDTEAMNAVSGEPRCNIVCVLNACVRVHWGSGSACWQLVIVC